MARNIVRVVTPRKRRGWTASDVTLTIGAGGQAGQQRNTIGVNFRSKFDRDFMPGDTVGYSWLKGLWSQSAAGDSSREHLYLGLGFATTGAIASDLPDLTLHNGDLQLHDGRGLKEPTTLQTPMVPIQLATIDIESAGQRKVPAGGAAYELNLYGASQNSPSAGSFEFTGVLVILWLLG